MDKLLSNVHHFALLVEVPAEPNGTALPDPDDWPFIAAARIAARPVVAGKTRHFPPQTGVEAVTPGKFMARRGR